MGETWRPVVGYDGYYEVSDAGNVRSVERVAVRKNGRPHRVRSTIRKPKRLPKGHLMVTLVRDGHLSSHTVHKLVLEAFAGPRPPGCVSRHLNGDPAVNRLANLAWGTPSENQVDAVRHGAHHLASRDACLRGHLLAPPNLAPTNSGRRVCLACKREHTNARDEGRAFDPERADARYADVLAGRRRHKSERRL